MLIRRRELLVSSVTSLVAAVAAPAPLRRWPIGMNTAVTGWPLLDTIQLAHDLKFDTLEIHPMGVPEATAGQFPGFRFDALSEAQKKAIRTALRGFPHITTHLPYNGLDYFSADEKAAEAAVRTVDIALEGSAYFGARLAVFHPKEGKGHKDLASQWPQMIRSIRRWGDLARRHKMQIALETGYPMSIADFVRLVKEVDHPAVGATIDVGHQGRYAELVAKVNPEDRATPAGIRAYNDATLAIIDGLGSKVIHLHVHDIDPPTWKEHLPIGTGFVDYPRLFRKLDEIRYRGSLVLEIAAPADRMRGLLADNKQRLEKFRGIS